MRAIQSKQRLRPSTKKCGRINFMSTSQGTWPDLLHQTLIERPQNAGIYKFILMQSYQRPSFRDVSNKTANAIYYVILSYWFTTPCDLMWPQN